MKILFDFLTITFSSQSGVFVYSQRILDSWHKIGIQNVKILSSSDMCKDLKERYPGYEILSINLPVGMRYAYRCIRTSRLRVKAINASGCDVVFYPMPEPYFFHIPNIPQVTVVHDLYYPKSHWYQKWLMIPWQLSNSFRLICISQYSRNETVKKLPWLKNKIKIIHNGIDYDLNPQSSIISGHFVLNVNTLYDYKNADTLVRAFCKLINYDSLKLIFVGSDVDNHWRRLLEIAKHYGKENKIFRLERLTTEELTGLYQHADLFVSPSIMEGFGQTPIEAAIQKCPVISSRCAALPESTMELVNYYEPALSSDSLASLMQHLLECPPADDVLEFIAEKFKKEYNTEKQSLSIYNYIIYNVISSQSRQIHSKN